MADCRKCLGTGHPDSPGDDCCTLCGGTGELYRPGDHVFPAGRTEPCVILRTTSRAHEAELLFPNGHRGHYSVHDLRRSPGGAKR